MAEGNNTGDFTIIGSLPFTSDKSEELYSKILN